MYIVFIVGHISAVMPISIIFNIFFTSDKNNEMVKPSFPFHVIHANRR
jgi:hypothetical protein